MSHPARKARNPTLPPPFDMATQQINTGWQRGPERSDAGSSGDANDVATGTAGPHPPLTSSLPSTPEVDTAARDTWHGPDDGPWIRPEGP